MINDPARQRVRREFYETPGLCVTISQAARLFGLSEDVCAQILDDLVADTTLQKSGSYYGALRRDFVGTLFARSIKRHYL
jgi:hypothetical protein